MTTDVLLEVTDPSTVASVTGDPGQLVEVLVGESTTTRVPEVGTQMEVLEPAQPPLNTLRAPLELSYVATLGPTDTTVILNGSASVTLPQASTVTNGTYFVVKNIGTVAATVYPQAATIDGQVTPLTLNQWEKVTLLAHDGNWLLV